MPTATRTVTINAAFLQEIKEDSASLQRKLHDTANRLSPGHASLGSKQLAELLGDLRDEVALYFALEGAYGYFDDALGVEPHFAREAETLRGEHRDLFLLLCDLEERSEQLWYHEISGQNRAAVATGFQAFYRRFLEHEAREDDLILAALADTLANDD